MNKQSNQPSLFIGIDWADQKYDCYIIDRDGKGFHQEIAHSPAEIDTWVAEMLQLADGKRVLFREGNLHRQEVKRVNGHKEPRYNYANSSGCPIEGFPTAFQSESYRQSRNNLLRFKLFGLQQQRQACTIV